MPDPSEAGEKDVTFALELEGATSVVHLIKCKRFASDWSYPFDTYEDAFEFGRSHEGRSYPRNCRLCDPERFRVLRSQVEERIILEGVNLIQAYNVCLSWLLHINSDVASAVAPHELTAVHDMGEYDPGKKISIKLGEANGNVALDVEVTIKDIQSVMQISGVSGLSTTVEDLRAYLRSGFEMGASEYDPLKNVVNAFKNLFRPREPIATASAAVYERLPKMRLFESRFLLLMAATMFSSFYLISFWPRLDILLENALFFVATYGVAFLYLYLVYKADKYEREPYILVLLVFCWGVFSGILAGLLNSLLGPYFSQLYGSYTLVAAFVEEPVKALGLYALARHRRYGREFNTPLDGIVYGFAVGIGFFAMENFYYFLREGPWTLAIRALLTWDHGVFVAITGLWLGIAKAKRGRVVLLDLVPGMLVAVFLHMVWNEVITFLGAIDGSFILIFLIWEIGYLRKMIKEAQRDEALWGYATGKAPIELHEQ
jgi:RsiW-degrading membrane proteinase PrsW (M82 family)